MSLRGTAPGERVELLALLCFAGGLAVGCDGERSSTPVGPTAPAPQAAPRTWVRAGNFASDLPQVDVLIDGAVRFPALGYSRITSYQEIGEGAHRVEFVLSDSKRSGGDPLGTAVTAARGEALTVSAAGLFETHSLRLLVLRDDLGTDAARARLRFVNAVPDFPASFDLATERTGLLFADVSFLEATGYRELELGNYDFEVRRNETVEVVIPVLSQGLARNANYTLYAFGSLRRDDFAARLVLDASSGAAAVRP